MELRHLRYFLAVAEELHFGRAAERLHIAQPPLSQQIRRLEEELGVMLFQRTKRRVQLTEAGRAFLEEARRTLVQAEQAVRAAQRAARGEVGRLVVGFVDSAAFNLLPVILRVFHERFPSVEMVLQEMATVLQVQALRDRQIHIGFVRPPVSDEHLHFETILKEPYRVALPSAHRLARFSSVALKELAGEPFIFPPHAAASFHSQIMELCRQAGFTPRIAQEAVRMQTLVSLVAAGMGVALVPASVANLGRLGVQYKPIREPTPLTVLKVVWRRDDSSPVLKSFLRVVREVARQAPPLDLPTGDPTQRPRRSAPGHYRNPLALYRASPTT